MPYSDKKLDGGYAASHKNQDPFPILAAPSHGKEKNTIREELITVACWKLDDVRFHFDSSFVLPASKVEFAEFAAVRASVPGAPLSLFGHADPVGDDAYNKKLSGRRAKAIYGVFTRDTALWEALYTNSEGTSDDWKLDHVQIMLGALGFPPGNTNGQNTAQTQQAVKDFQSKNGESPSGNADAATRAKIFKAYMDVLCPVTLAKSEFLSGGTGAGGKADYQGCSEFNPLMIFSATENQKFSASGDKTQRNAENQINRRVLGLFFRPGTKIDTSHWPCPTTAEGHSACTHRFWADAPKRRQNQEKRRTYSDDADTFACRFYERLVQFSPCEVPGDPRVCVYLHLRFEDPDGVIRDFPEHYPVTVRFSPPAAGPVRELRSTVGPNGRLTFPAFEDPKEYWRQFALVFDASPAVPYIVCEPHSAIASPPPAAFSRYATADTLDAALPHNERFFELPQTWQMPQGDWRLGPNGFPTANGEYASPPGIFKHVAALADMGSAEIPVEVILNPHWHFLRYEYYDRYYGNAHLDSPPRPALRRRISTPPLRVRGFRSDPNAAAPAADAFSNWTTGAASPPEQTNLIQSLPFVLRRDPAGTNFSPPSGAELGLKFETPEHGAAYSESLTSHFFVTSPPPAPGPDRLRFYDLPRLWKSRNYYTRRELSSPPAAGKFFQTLSAAEVTEAKQKTKPLVFSLDDMVLLTGDPATGTPGAPLSPPAPRVAIFNHRFDGRLPDSGPQGLYKNLSPPGPDEFEIPRSDIAAPANNYLFEYPDWTRLVVHGGNLFDVFDQRTPELSPPFPVGARAAVRWVDASQPFPGIAAFVFQNGVGFVPAPDNSPIPGRVLSPPITPRTDVPSANPIFSIHPHFQQRMARTQRLFTGADSQIGRYDLALLRCSDVQGGNEVAPTFSYFRQNFNFLSPPPPSPPVPVAMPISRPHYALLQAQNVANRWTGDEPGASEIRAVVVPRPQSPPAGSPPPFRAPSIWFLQSLPIPQSHFALQISTGGRDNRGSQLGNGDSGNTNFQTESAANPEPSMQLWFTSAHETGHMSGLPDEYNERWNAGSYGQMSFGWNTPGDPYEPDGRDETDRFSRPDSGMMNGNKLMRNRYFWHNAEFVRQVTGQKMQVALGPDYPDYWLPEHAQAAAGRTHYCWPVAQSVHAKANKARSFDMYLYALGKDHYSQRLLGGGPPNGPFDGILVIDVKIAFSLPSSATPAILESRRQDILTRANAAVRLIMNNKWYAAGTLNIGTETVTFRRCLIQAVPQAAVFNHPHDPSPPPDGGEQQNANTMLARFGYDFQVNVSRPTAPAAAAWQAANPEMLDIDLAGSNANMDGLFIRHFPSMIFGTDKDLSAVAPSPTAVTAADWVPIVQRLIPGATVHPLP